MIGVIEKISPKGKSNVIRVDGADYWIKADIDISSMQVGGRLDFTYSPNVYNGKTYNWIKNWGAIPRDYSQGSSAAPGNGVHAPTSAPAQAVTNPPTPIGQPHVGAPTEETYIRPEHLACVSNFLAHAVQNGLIKAPEDIAKYVYSLRDALLHQEAPF